MVVRGEPEPSDGPRLARNDRFHSRDEFRRWCEGRPSGRYERVDGRIVANGSIAIDPPGFASAVEEIYSPD